MIRPTVLCAVLASANLCGDSFANSAPVLPVPSVAPAGKDDLLKALEQWLGAYRRGKLDLVNLDRFKGKQLRAKDFVSIKLGVVSRAKLRDFSHEKELKILCERAAELGSSAAIDMLLRVAEIGLDGKSYSHDRLPSVVRRIGENALGQIGDGDGRKRLREIAKLLSGPTSIAAVRALGRFRDEVDRPSLEAAVRHESPEMRLAGAIALRHAKLATALETLGDALERESIERVAGAMCDALTSIAADLAERQQERSLRRATTSVIRSLGKFSWQVDHAALAFLKRVRAADTVPALIAVLQRWTESTDASRLERHSGLVRHAAHELLISLTGAHFPMARPDQWKAWWETSQDGFKVVDEASERARQQGEGETSTGTFFGIPVRGSHVLFIVDFSGSMEAPSHVLGESNGERLIRMAVTRRELRGAVDKMAPDGRFNLVWFNHKTGAWKPKLVDASMANKKRFYKYLDKTEPDGATNLWGGLKLGLDMKSKKSDGGTPDRYESHVDEIFVLSDGAPTAGEIIDPAQILVAVRDANESRRIRINTVYISGPNRRGGGGGGGGRRGRQPPFEMKAPELMRRLAKENGGVFIQPGVEEGKGDARRRGRGRPRR